MNFVFNPQKDLNMNVGQICKKKQKYKCSLMYRVWKTQLQVRETFSNKSLNGLNKMTCQVIILYGTLTFCCTMAPFYSNKLPYEYMLALRTESEATSWQPFVRPDPWLSSVDHLPSHICKCLTSKKTTMP